MLRAMGMLDIADRSWPLLRRVMGLHTAAYKASGGRIGHTFPGLPTMLILEHVGAKSGKVRDAPLLYFRDGDDLVIVASKGGYPKHPAWYHNLKAHPETTVLVGREKRAVRAREATPQEHERLWPKAVTAYSGYAEYQARTERRIPLMILERR